MLAALGPLLALSANDTCSPAGHQPGGTRAGWGTWPMALCGQYKGWHVSFMSRTTAVARAGPGVVLWALRVFHYLHRARNALMIVVARLASLYPFRAATRAVLSPQLLDMVNTRRSGAAAALQHCRLHSVMARLQQLPRGDHPPIATKQAAVLVALFEQEGLVSVWLTVRCARLNTHQGEVCLPGGKRDPEDTCDAATALREAEEEIGLPPDSAQVGLGCRGHAVEDEGRGGAPTLVHRSACA